MGEGFEDLEKDMTPILLEELGMRFATEKSKCRRSWGLYQCQYCGKEFEVSVSDIKSKRQKSCGCLKKINNVETNNIIHGLKYHPLYSTWKNMKHRCYTKGHPKYIYYGARGIKVCDRWLDIKNFIEDVYPSWEKGLTLDRIDVNGDYEPSNYRWVNMSIQMRNTRDIMITNTSGFRGVIWMKDRGAWGAKINVNKERIYLGSYTTALEAAKAYERYVRLNNLEHNFTPALTEDEISELEKLQALEAQNDNSI